MKAVAVVGHSDTGKTTAVERLVSALGDRGAVGTVKHIDCEPSLDTAGKDTARHRAAGSVQTYGIAGGEWFATGDSLTLEDALDRLAQSCEYALVEGYSGAGLPTIVLGDRPVEDGEEILRAEGGETLDLTAAIEAIEATEPFETLSSLIRAAKASPDSELSGAIATFTGRVRTKEGPDDDPTKQLEFEKYDGVAEEKLATIKAELEARDGVYEVLLHHRTGVVRAEEDIVFVVVLAGHRTEAFATVEDGINRLKEEVPLFKKEVTVAEEFWAHE